MSEQEYEIGLSYEAGVCWVLVTAESLDDALEDAHHHASTSDLQGGEWQPIVAHIEHTDGTVEKVWEQ